MMSLFSWFRKQEPRPGVKKRYVRQTIPRGKPVANFRALEDFYSPDTKSQYCAGMGYTIRKDATQLQLLAERWAEEGKIQFGSTEPEEVVEPEHDEPADIERTEPVKPTMRVKKTNNGAWVVIAVYDGRRVAGPFNTEEEAQRALSEG